MKLQQELKEIKRNNERLSIKNKMQRDWEDLYRSIDELCQMASLDKRELEERSARVRTDLVSDARSLWRKQQRKMKEEQRQNTRIQVIQEQTDSFIEQLEEAQESLDKVESVYSNLEVLKKAFSTNGLIAYKIENLVKELEELVNTYLGELSDGRFTLEFVVSNDKLNVQITDNGNIVDILASLQGELSKSKYRYSHSYSES